VSRRAARPLDRLRSIKLKLGTLVAVTVVVAATATAVGIRQGLSPVYTVPAAVAAALLVTQLLARGMTSPLREMTRAARAMATGDYSRRVRVSSNDEVGELGRAFNTMAAELAAVDRQRRDLVANVSHELRTPVSALRAVLENLVDGVAEADPVTLRAALGQTERLSRLVTDLLDLSRVEAGVVPLRPEPVELQTFLTDAVREAQVGDRPVSHAVEVEPGDLAVHADPERLHQLVANLLDNADRHSPEGGTVTLRAVPADGPDRVLLDVTDEGPGIPVGERTAVFGRFIRGDTGPARDSDGGTGLGLAIAQWVAHLHHGSIEVVEADRGCLIRVTLPRNPRRIS